MQEVHIQFKPDIARIEVRSVSLLALIRLLVFRFPSWRSVSGKASFPKHYELTFHLEFTLAYTHAHSIVLLSCTDG